MRSFFSRLLDLLIASTIAISALVVSIISLFQSRKIASSDFSSSERLKEDIAGFIAAIRFFTYSFVCEKWLFYAYNKRITVEEKSLALAKEKIKRFMLSPTSLALFIYATERSKNEHQQNRGSDWVFFFMHTYSLIHTDDVDETVSRARSLEHLMSQLKEIDIRHLCRILNDLPKAIQDGYESLNNDQFLKMYFDANKSEMDDETFAKFIVYLANEKNVDNPNVYLFLAAQTGDASLWQEAIANGASKTCTQDRILAEYKKYLDEFLHGPT